MCEKFRVSSQFIMRSFHPPSLSVCLSPFTLSLPPPSQMPRGQPLGSVQKQQFPSNHSQACIKIATDETTNQRMPTTPSQSPKLEDKLSKPVRPSVRRPSLSVSFTLRLTSRTMLGFSAAGDDNPRSGEHGEGGREGEEVRRRWCPRPTPPRCNCRCLTRSALVQSTAVRFFSEGLRGTRQNI